MENRTACYEEGYKPVCVVCRSNHQSSVMIGDAGINTSTKEVTMSTYNNSSTTITTKLSMFVVWKKI